MVSSKGLNNHVVEFFECNFLSTSKIVDTFLLRMSQLVHYDSGHISTVHEREFILLSSLIKLQTLVLSPEDLLPEPKSLIIWPNDISQSQRKDLEPILLTSSQQVSLSPKLFEPVVILPLEIFLIFSS
jgi:hypothetical protein